MAFFSKPTAESDPLLEHGGVAPTPKSPKSPKSSPPTKKAVPAIVVYCVAAACAMAAAACAVAYAAPKTTKTALYTLVPGSGNYVGGRRVWAATTPTPKTHYPSDGALMRTCYSPSHRLPQQDTASHDFVGRGKPHGCEQKEVPPILDWTKVPPDDAEFFTSGSANSYFPFTDDYYWNKVDCEKIPGNWYNSCGKEARKCSGAGCCDLTDPKYPAGTCKLWSIDGNIIYASWRCGVGCEIEND